jgi:hypothetical protein
MITTKKGINKIKKKMIQPRKRKLPQKGTNKIRKRAIKLKELHHQKDDSYYQEGDDNKIKRGINKTKKNMITIRKGTNYSKKNIKLQELPHIVARRRRMEEEQKLNNAQK